MPLAMFGFEAMNRIKPDFYITVAAIYAYYFDVPLATWAKFVVMFKPLAQTSIMKNVAAVQLAEGLNVQAYLALGLQDLHILCDHL